MKNIILAVKGFFIGIANLIPGISGGTIAIVLGIYDKLINSISHFFSKFKDNVKFLLPIFIGIAISILTMSKAISFALENWLFPTVLFFIGAIMGGIPMLHGKIKNTKMDFNSYIVFVISFTVIVLLTFASGDSEVSFETLSIVGYIKLFLVGVIAAATMIVPGVSGAAVLMTLGYYAPILAVVKNLTDFSMLSHNLAVVIPFGLGVVIGIFAVAKLIEFLFKKYEKQTYYGVLGFVTSSILAIIIQNFTSEMILSFSLLEIIIGVIAAVIGFALAYKLGDK